MNVPFVTKHVDRFLDELDEDDLPLEEWAKTFFVMATFGSWSWRLYQVLAAVQQQRLFQQMRSAARATSAAAETSMRTESVLKQMRADAIADAATAAAREAVMLRWTIAGVFFAALAFIAAVVAIVLGLTR